MLIQNIYGDRNVAKREKIEDDCLMVNVFNC